MPQNNIRLQGFYAWTPGRITIFNPPYARWESWSNECDLYVYNFQNKNCINTPHTYFILYKKGLKTGDLKMQLETHLLINNLVSQPQLGLLH